MAVCRFLRFLRSVYKRANLSSHPGDTVDEQYTTSSRALSRGMAARRMFAVKSFESEELLVHKERHGPWLNGDWMNGEWLNRIADRLANGSVCLLVASWSGGADPASRGDGGEADHAGGQAYGGSVAGGGISASGTAVSETSASGTAVSGSIVGGTNRGGTNRIGPDRAEALRMQRLLRSIALRFSIASDCEVYWKQSGTELVLLACAQDAQWRGSEDDLLGRLAYLLRDTVAGTMSGQAAKRISGQSAIRCGAAEVEGADREMPNREDADNEERRRADGSRTENALVAAWQTAWRRSLAPSSVLRCGPSLSVPSEGGLDFEVRYSPIVSLLDGTLFGYEAVPYRLSSGERWPADEMFAEAEAVGRLYECDRRFRETAIRGLPIRRGEAKLFLPVPAGIIYDARLYPGTTLRRIEAAGLRPEHVVLRFALRPEGEELDERALRAALRHYRVQGFRISLSGLSVDRDSLRRMLELHPDYAEIDVGWMERDPDGSGGTSGFGGSGRRSDAASPAAGTLTRHPGRTVDETLLGAIAALARKEQVVLLATGIERESQLGPLVTSGIGYGRGGWIGPEEAKPAATAASVRERIRFEVNKRYRKEAGSLSELTMPVETFGQDTPVSEIARLFENHREAHGFVIAEEGRPVGLLMKEKLHQMLSGQFGLPLYWNRPVGKIMDTQPMTVDESTPIDLVSQMAMSREPDKLYDAVVVTRDGVVRGIASIRALLEWVTHARMADAQWANPLTGLPGNEPIRRELTRRIGDGKPFAVLYADVDHFKWFNDRFGFHRGDEVIRFTAETLLACARAQGQEDGFVGHIGGDDFIVVSSCDGSIDLASAVLKQFEIGIAGYVGQDAGPVLDRDGLPADADGLTLSLSLLLCEQTGGWTPDLLAERAALLKKRAKKQRGNALAWESLSWSPTGGTASTLTVGTESTS